MGWGVVSDKANKNIMRGNDTDNDNNIYAVCNENENIGYLSLGVFLVN